MSEAVDSNITPTPKRRWYDFRLGMLIGFGIVVAAVLGWVLLRNWYEQRVVTHLHSLRAGVMLKPGHSYVKASTVDNISKFFKEASGDLRFLAQNGSLELDLSGTKVLDGDLEQLEKIRLQSVNLRHCKITEDAVTKLRQALPDCTINWEPSQSREQKKKAAPAPHSSAKE